MTHEPCDDSRYLKYCRVYLNHISFLLPPPTQSFKASIIICLITNQVIDSLKPSEARQCHPDLSDKKQCSLYHGVVHHEA